MDVTKLDDDNYTKNLSREKILEALKASVVTHLNLHGQIRCVTWPNESIRALFTPTIQSLDLAENMLYDRGGYAIAYALRECSSLTSLNLSLNRIGEAMERVFSTIAANNIPITTLDCSFNQMTGSEIPALIELLSRSTTLISLTFSLESGKVVDEGLFQVLKKNTLLQELNILEHTEVSAFAVEDCFSENRTIIRGRGAGGISKFIAINHICNTYNTPEPLRRSIPPQMIAREEIDAFVKDLTHKNEPSKLMKLVVLGNGNSGKTTLIKAFQHAKKSWFKRHFMQQRIVKVLLASKPTVGIECSSLKFEPGYVSVWDIGAHAESVVPSFFFPSETAVYLICYDLSLPHDMQQQQLEFWLDFLNSSLPPALSPSPSLNWKVIFVGLKKDIRKQQDDAPVWEAKWPRIPFHDTRFAVSSSTFDGIKELLYSVENVCASVFKHHSPLVPSSYKKVLQSLQLIPESESIRDLTHLLPEHYHICSQDVLGCTVAYLNAIGQVVLKNGLVCTSRHIIPTIAAHHCEHLRRVPDLNFVLLEELDESSKYSEQLKMLSELGVCYKLADSRPMYLFPSLSSVAGEINFVRETAEPHLHLAGLRVAAPQGLIFIPAFFSSLVVTLLKKLNVSLSELCAVHRNSISVSCKGMFAGELLVTIDDDARSIVALMKATNPDLAIVHEILADLTHKVFPQYIACKQQILCPTCVDMSYIRKEVAPAGINCDPTRHQVDCLPHPETAAYQKCWTHAQQAHDVYLSYRELFEGTKSRFSTSEGEGGLLELIYRKLATSKKRNGDPVYAFWDKMCLNYRQDWDNGTLQGLLASKVIVLFISYQVIDNIANLSFVRQENMLVEYEYALLQHQLNRAKVIPVYVAEINADKKFEPFNAEKAVEYLRDVPHVRQKHIQSYVEEQSGFLLEEKRAELNSIKKTVEAILRLPGSVRLDKRGEDGKDIKTLIDTVVSAL